MSARTLRIVRADPAGNVTLLVLSPVPASLRPGVAVELLRRLGGEQAGFLTEPRLGGEARLEMMGGEFCGNALRCLGALRARETRDGTHRLEISGAQRVLTVETGLPGGVVRGEMPLPDRMEIWNGLETAVFPGIVHALCRGGPREEAHARRLTAALSEHYGAPAAGVLYLREEDMTMIPAVYVRDTDTLYFENSCASGSAAAAALLARERGSSGEFCLHQPGGTITARAAVRSGRLENLTVEGPVVLGEVTEAEIDAEAVLV